MSETLPRTVDEIPRFFAALTPDDWALARLGLVSVLAVVAIIGLGLWLALRD